MGAAFRVKLGTNDLNCVDVSLNPTHSLTRFDAITKFLSADNDNEYQLRLYNVTNATYTMDTTAQSWKQQATNQSFLRSGVDRIVRTMRAPLIGGLEYIGRIRIFSCDIVRWASSGDEQTKVNAPTRSPENHQFNSTVLPMQSTH